MATPVPGRAPTLRLETYGQLTLLPPPGRSEDAYSLFLRRSAAMGWLTWASNPSDGGLWGANEAALEPSAEPPSRVGLFQVVRTNVAEDGVPLQAFFACVSQVLSRLAHAELSAIVCAIPAETVDEGQAASPAGLRIAKAVLEGGRFFADLPTESRVAIRATLETGEVAADPDRIEALRTWLRAMSRGLFVCESVEFSRESVGYPYSSNDVETQGYDAIVALGQLGEWSLDALGWLTAFIADGASRNGFDQPLRLTIART